PVYSLTNYIVLGRILYYVPYFSPIHPGRVISTFVGLDIIVAILTGNGAAQVSNIDNSATGLRLGRGLLRTSILLQVICFLGFIALEVIFHRRCLRGNVLNQKLRMIIILLYASSALILIRNVYRVVEVFQGYTGYLQNHEAFFYVFDGTLMLINSIMLNLYHPMMFLPHSNKTYLCRNGVTETEGTGWVDKRPFLVTVFDPLDLVGLLTGRNKTTKFWETEQAQGDDPRLHGEHSLAIAAPAGTRPPLTGETIHG
ncbi:hypothetical protein MMC07_009710, partial [Pseudocyphellaria aurata]|nr:hypothetical protein [Pseudocyphellaria aurata]